MGQLLYLPAYLLFVSALLKVFVFPATEPTRYGVRLLVGMTALQALTLATLGVAWIRWAVPALHEAWVDRYRPRRWQFVAGVGFVILLVIIAGFKVLQQNHESVVPQLAIPSVVQLYEQQHPPTQSSLPAPAAPPTLPPPTLPAPAASPPPPPTLQELTHSPDVAEATSVIDIDVEILHHGWDALTASHKDALCEAGKAIRSAMHRYNNTLADLNHAQRAIYDITAPRGRCR